MATEYLFSNNATTTLAQSVSATATVLNVESGDGDLFPSPSTNQAFAVTLVDASTGLINEICYCTSRSGDQLTVIRGQEGTNATSWLAGDTCANFITADVIENWLQKSDLDGYATEDWVSAGFEPLLGFTPVQQGSSIANDTQMATGATKINIGWDVTGSYRLRYYVNSGTTANSLLANMSDFETVQSDLTAEITRAKSAETELSSTKANRSGDTFSGAITIDEGSGNSSNIFLSSGGSAFWQLQLASATYGSVFGVLRYVAGVYVDTPFSINNSTGVATFLEQPVVPTATVPTAPVNLGQLTSMPHGAVALHPGTTSWTVPAGVYSIDVEAWGGGGGGGAANNGSAAGGAGGGYCRGCFAVTPGQVIPVSIGSGGAGGTTGNGSSGGSTTVLGMTASGGSYGLPGINTSASSGGGVGGTSTGGQVNLTGYVGQGASEYVNGYISSGMGGGTFQTSHTAFITGSGAGYSGNSPGGGGSGASALDRNNYTGGNGADGMIVITW